MDFDFVIPRFSIVLYKKGEITLVILRSERENSAGSKEGVNSFVV